MLVAGQNPEAIVEYNFGMLVVALDVEIVVAGQNSEVVVEHDFEVLAGCSLDLGFQALFQVPFLNPATLAELSNFLLAPPSLTDLKEKNEN